MLLMYAPMMPLPKVVTRVVASQDIMALSLARSSPIEPSPPLPLICLPGFTKPSHKLGSLTFYSLFIYFFFFISFLSRFKALRDAKNHPPTTLSVVTLAESPHPKFAKSFLHTLSEMPFIPACTPQHPHHLIFLPLQLWNSSSFNFSLRHEVGNCPSYFHHCLPVKNPYGFKLGCNQPIK